MCEGTIPVDIKIYSKRLQKLMGELDNLRQNPPNHIELAKAWHVSVMSLLDQIVGKSHHYYLAFQTASDPLFDGKADVNWRPMEPILKQLQAELDEGIRFDTGSAVSVAAKSKIETVLTNVELLLQELVQLLRDKKSI